MHSCQPESSDGSSNLKSLSIRELRQELQRRNIDTAGCIEKPDLLDRLSQAIDSVVPKRRRTSPSPRPASNTFAFSSDAHGGQKQQCPICLEDIERSPDTCSCASCCTTFHKSCAASHALSAAEAGRLPLLCPVQTCKERWPTTLIGDILSVAELGRYNAAVRSVRELRQNGSAQLSPRSAKVLEALGIRKCPKCGVGIEKQQSGITHGCNKMTCRCGCKFCYVCGIQATPTGEARCQCVGPEHSYLRHESVLRNYSDDPLHGFPFSFGAPINSTYPFGGGTYGMPMSGNPIPFVGFPLGDVQGFGAAIAQGVRNMVGSMNLGEAADRTPQSSFRSDAGRQQEPVITILRDPQASSTTNKST